MDASAHLPSFLLKEASDLGSATAFGKTTSPLWAFVSSCAKEEVAISYLVFRAESRDVNSMSSTLDLWEEFLTGRSEHKQGAFALGT